ncbi:12280_t:CDS:2, partial [Dentiscutata erythropus]
MDDTNLNAIFDIYLSSPSYTHAFERTTNDLTCVSNFNDLSASSSSLQFQTSEQAINTADTNYEDAFYVINAFPSLSSSSQTSGQTKNNSTCTSNFHDQNAPLSSLLLQLYAFEQARNTTDVNFEDVFYEKNNFSSFSSSLQEDKSTFYENLNASCSSSQIQTSEETNNVEMETSEKTNNVEIECESTFRGDINASWSSSQIQTSEETNNVEMECESTFHEDINASCSSTL